MKLTNLPRIEPKRISEQATDHIRRLILTEKLTTGDRLPAEAELARLLNISRPTLREGLRVLESEGLIIVKRGSGIYVNKNRPSMRVRGTLLAWLRERKEAVEDLLRVREYIEGLTATLAASRASDSEIEEIRSVYEEQASKLQELKSKEDLTVDELADLDTAFHLKISKASGSEIANEIIQRILPEFRESNEALIFIFGRRLKMDKEHQEIIDAIESRNAAAAERTMRAHIQRVIEDLRVI